MTLSFSTDFDVSKGIGGSADLSNLVKTYTVSGKLASANGEALEGIGCAFIKLYANGVAEIQYTLKFETGGSSTTNFKWGILPANLKALNNNLPDITAVSGGVGMLYKSNGSLETELNAYGGSHDAQGGYWVFSRVYDTSGHRGSFPSNAGATGSYWVGTCYGTYTV